MSVQGYQPLETAPFHIIAVQRNHELKEQLEKHNEQLKTFIETQAERRSSEWIQDVKNHTDTSARLLETADKTDGLSRETLELVHQVRLKTNILKRKVIEEKKQSGCCRSTLVICGVWLAAAALMTAIAFSAKDLQ